MPDVRPRTASERLGLALTAVGTVLLGWWFVAPGTLGLVFGDGAVTKPVTAGCIVALGAVLSGMVPRGRVHVAVLGLVVASSVETLVTAALGRSSVFAYVLFPDVWRRATPDGSGQMAVSSALALLALAVGLALRRRSVTTALALLSYLLGYGSLIGHLYGVVVLSDLETVTFMATVTAGAVMAAGIAAMVRPGMPLALLLADRGTAGALARWLIPTAMLVPPLVGWLQLEGERMGWYGPRYGLALIVLTFALVTAATVFVTGRTAGRIDRARERAVEDLEALNLVLEEKVASAVEEAEEGRERLRVLLEHTPVGIFETGPDGHRRYTNRRWREIAGLSLDAEAAGSWTEILHPDDREWVVAQWHDAIASGQELSARYRYLRPDGAVVWVDTVAVAIRSGEGEVLRWLGSVTDVTEQVLSEERLRRSEDQFRAAMAHAPIGMAIVELDGRFRDVNHALCRLVGYAPEELQGSTFQQITHPDDLASDLEHVADLLAGETDHYAMDKRYVTRAGDTVWVRLAVSLARDDDGSPAYFVAQMQDISAARMAAQQLVHRALHDPLTGLPNRDLLMDHIAHALARATRTGGRTAVMFCDLDGFKTVNDTHGHEVGDRLLVHVADRLRAAVRPGDTVARLGGDEFVVVAEDLDDEEAARALAGRILDALSEPAEFSGLVLRPGASIGVSVAVAEDDARSVLRDADAAMYRAKSAGRGRVALSHDRAESGTAGLLPDWAE